MSTEFDIIRHYRPLNSPPPPPRGSRCGRPVGFASRPGQARHVRRSSPRRRGESCLKAGTGAADANSLTFVRSVCGSARASKNDRGRGPAARGAPWPSRRRRPSSRPLAGARNGLAAHKLSAKRALEGLARWRAERRVQVSRCSPWPWRLPSRQAGSRQGEARRRAGPLGTLGERAVGARMAGRGLLRAPEPAAHLVPARRREPPGKGNDGAEAKAASRLEPVRPSPMNVARCSTASRGACRTVIARARPLTPSRHRAEGGVWRKADGGVRLRLRGSSKGEPGEPPRLRALPWIKAGRGKRREAPLLFPS